MLKKFLFIAFVAVILVFTLGFSPATAENAEEDYTTDQAVADLVADGYDKDEAEAVVAAAVLAAANEEDEEDAVAEEAKKGVRSASKKGRGARSAGESNDNDILNDVEKDKDIKDIAGELFKELDEDGADAAAAGARGVRATAKKTAVKKAPVRPAQKLQAVRKASAQLKSKGAQKKVLASVKKAKKNPKLAKKLKKTIKSVKDNSVQVTCPYCKKQFKANANSQMVK